MSPGEPSTAVEYTPRLVEAARRVLVELWQCLGAYREAMVLVGGWVPELLLPAASPPHTGSLDVDILLNPAPLANAQYAELLALLERSGYTQTDKPFRYERQVMVDEGPAVTVEVDFLVPRGASPPRSSRARPGFRAIDADGVSLALVATETRAVQGTMPGGAHNRVEVLMASMEAFVVMKAHALERRLKAKDAYDIVFCLRNWPGGCLAVAERLRPHAGHEEVRRALEILAAKFDSVGSIGPQNVVAFLDPSDPEERAYAARDAFERVQSLLSALGFDRANTGCSVPGPSQV